MKIQIKIIVSLAWLAFYSAELGAAWTTKRLTNNTGNSLRSKIAVNGSDIYVVWEDETPGNKEIFFKKSNDGGTTWQIAKRLTNNSGSSFGPQIALSGANVFVVWCDDTTGNYEVFFKKSTDGGMTWQASKRLTYNSGNSLYPKIAVSNTNIYVVWHDNTPGNCEIYFKKSTNGGTSWQAAKRLTNNSGDSGWPCIAVSGSNVYMAWSDYTSGNFEIYFRKSTDGGATWQTAKRLTNNSGGSSFSAIAVSGSNIHIVWEDFTPGNYEIFCITSINDGATWQTAKRLTNNSGSSMQSQIAVSNANVYVVWEDISPGNWEIYFIKSANGGTTWQSTQRITNDTGDSGGSAIALNTTNIFVDYADNTPGNSEIYLKYSPL